MSASSKKPQPAAAVRHQAKFNRILDAAVHVFASKGFHGAKIGEIAQLANVADGTIYLYFKNKQDLMACLLDHRLDTLIKGLHQKLRGVEDPKAQLLRIVAYHFAMVAHHPQLFLLIRQQLPCVQTSWSKAIRQKVELYLHVWVDVLHQGRTQGIFTHAQSDCVTARMLYGAFDSACALWAEDKSGTADTLKKLRQQSCDVALHWVNATR